MRNVIIAACGLVGLTACATAQQTQALYGDLNAALIVARAAEGKAAALIPNFVPRKTPDPTNPPVQFPGSSATTDIPPSWRSVSAQACSNAVIILHSSPKL